MNTPPVICRPPHRWALPLLANIRLSWKDLQGTNTILFRNHWQRRKNILLRWHLDIWPVTERRKTVLLSVKLILSKNENKNNFMIKTFLSLVQQSFGLKNAFTFLTLVCLSYFWERDVIVPVPLNSKLSAAPGNTKRESITVPLTSCLTGLESALLHLTIFCFYLQNRLIQTGGQLYSDTSPFSVPWLHNQRFGAIS